MSDTILIKFSFLAIPWHPIRVGVPWVDLGGGPKQKEPARRPAPPLSHSHVRKDVMEDLYSDPPRATTPRFERVERAPKQEEANPQRIGLPLTSACHALGKT